MSRIIHACRPLTAILMLACLALAGAGVGAAGANASPATGAQWGIAPGGGPASGGATLTITPSPGHFTQTSAGDHDSLAIGADGNLYTWGRNDYGQLGRDTGSADHDQNPGMVAKPAGVTTWTQISAGYDHSMAVASDGNLYTWGWNSYGQLGRDTGSADRDQNPGMVAKPAGVDKWTQISAGNDYSMAVGSDGNLYTWGGNVYGELGRDTGSAYSDRNPGMVAKPAGVDKWTQISAGDNHSLAMGSDGNLYTWGGNSWGQLGRDTGSDIQDQNPGMVAKPAGVDKWTQISAGSGYSMAVGSDDNLYTWGVNLGDELGRDTGGANSDRNPGMVTKPAGVDKWTQISAGDGHSLVMGSDGNLYTWGWNLYGQLGRDTGSAYSDRNPGMVAKPAGATTWTQVIAGYDHSLAMVSDGSLYTWGSNFYGELGRDTGGADRDGKPGLVVFPGEVRLTSVKFDGVAGTGLTARADGTWSVTPPAHAAGTVTVSVSWTLNGVAQPDAHLSYTYEAAPVVTRTVAFDSAGGSAVPAQRVTDGARAVRPADPTRDGYRFTGWFNGTDAYGFDRPVTGDLTLTAHWTRNAGQKPADPAKKPADPAGQDPSGVLSSTGSDTMPILTVGLLALAVGGLALAGVRTRRAAAHQAATRQD